MDYLIYVSTAKRLITEADLLDILTTSREKNLKYNVTGVLLYNEGAFIQMLEGAYEHIHLIYNRLLQDPRHKNIIKLVEGNSMARSFPNWSMGFQTINSELFKKILAGYFDLSERKFEGPHPGLLMIRTFNQNNRLH